MPLISGLRLVLAASLVVLLAGCGGGGKKKPPPPPPPPPVAQTIVFADAGPIAKTFGDAPFTNAASGGAGTGAITYSSGSTGVATVDAAGQVTILMAGSAVITASKAADAGHLSATASYTVNIAPAAQTIAFANAGPIAKTFGDAPFSNAASGGAGTGTITYSSGSTGVATVDAAGQVTILTAGSAVITASKAADAGHLAATASYTVNIARAAQTIAFDSPGPINKQVGDAPFANVASGGAGTGVITYSSGSTGVATVDGTGQVAIVAAGSAVITATKAESENHLAAQATYTVNVVVPSAIEAPFTAWLNLTDASPVNLPSAAGGTTFSRTVYGNCPSPLSPPSACTAVTSTVLGATTLDDSAAGLGRNAHYWLQRGATVARPTIVTSRRYYDAPMSPVEHDGQLWIVGGNEGREIWSSTDGRAWVQRRATTPWGTRAGAQLLQFGGRFYLIAGTGPGTGVDFNDVWRSDDLLNWTRILASGPFAARTAHQVAVLNDRMWLIGGINSQSDQRYNDVWWSTDGVTWTRATANAAFSERRDHQRGGSSTDACGSWAAAPVNRTLCLMMCGRRRTA